jgi:hypothetical protein
MSAGRWYRPESPIIGLGHLQFEGLITNSRLSTKINDLA